MSSILKQEWGRREGGNKGGRKGRSKGRREEGMEERKEEGKERGKEKEKKEGGTGRELKIPHQMLAFMQTPKLRGL